MSLEVQIKKQLGRFRLNVAFETGEGLTGLLGASGCGKSMTLKCIAGLVTPDEGRVVLDGRVLFDSVKGISLPPQRRRVGYLFQHYALFPNMTVEQNIAAGVREKGRREETVAALAQAFYLEELGKKYPRQLSGGQQQRVAIARALALQPDVLCFDEPTSALDPELTGEVLKVIRGLAAQNTTMVIVTHEMAFARDVADQVIFMDGGVVVEQGAAQEVIMNPKEERTRHFLTRFSQS